MSTYDKAYRSRPEVKAKYAAYYRERVRNPEHKAKYRSASVRYQHKLRSQVIEKLGNKCSSCGFGDIRALQIDHIQGGGTKLRKGVSWRKFYLEILTDMHPHKVQVLCANCNWIKRHENKEMYYLV